MFDTQFSLLKSEVDGLQERITSTVTPLSLSLGQTLHSKTDLLGKKLGDLGSIRQTYVTQLADHPILEVEFRRTEVALQSLAINVGKIRQELTHKESLSSTAPLVTPYKADYTHEPTRNANYLQKVALPTFSGRVVEYPSFKQCFQDLTGVVGYPLSIVMEHLKTAIPRDHQHLVEASKSMDEVWARLDEKFGDRTMTILTVQRSLVNLDLSRYKEFEKVEKMHDEVCKGLRLHKRLLHKIFKYLAGL